MSVLKNNKKVVMFSLLVLFALFAASLLLINQETGNQKNTEAMPILVSILPQKEFVEAVGGELVSVQVLIPKGMSAETYDPSVQDLIHAQQAKVWFQVGHLPIESSVQNGLAQNNPSLQVIDTAINNSVRFLTKDEINAHESEHEETSDQNQQDHNKEQVDPHNWLSPTNAMAQVETIYQTLSNLDPEHASIYKQNAEAYLKKLNDLHAFLASKLLPFKGKKLMVFHPAWGYFADAYGLVQYPIEQEGKEPTAKELAQIIQTAKEEDIKVIFIQSQLSSQSAQNVAAQTGAVVIEIDPLAQNYIENLQQVGTIIGDNLQ